MRGLVWRSGSPGVLRRAKLLNAFGVRDVQSLHSDELIADWRLAVNGQPIFQDRTTSMRGTSCFCLPVLVELLTLAVPTIPAEVAPAGMLQLPMAFGADADHVGHDGACDAGALRAGVDT